MGDETQVQNPPQEDDLLEKLLAGAAQREADKKMQELEQKGVVTKAELGVLLKENNTQLIETITSAVAEQMQKAGAPSPAQASDQQDGQGDQQVQKGQRKGTIQGSSDPRSDNPIRYLIQKSRAGQDFDDLDKALIWGLTERGLSQGMTYYSEEVADFGDDSAY